MCGSYALAGQTEPNHKLVGSLWEIQSSLFGLSELFKNQSTDALFSVNGAHGIGIILGNLSCKLSHVAESIEQPKEA